MDRPEEKFARQLFDEITRQIVPAKRDVQLALEGGGVHWNCSISFLECSSTVHGFALSNEDPEFLTIFRASGREVATARTSSMEGTVRAVLQWLDGDDLPSLYKSFAFVDHWKRRLLSIRETILQRAPSLENGSELKCRGSGIYYLWFRDKTRSARISYYGKNEAPDAFCHWDDCELFKFHAVDPQSLANVVKRWLCDETKPSEMRKEFPALSIGKLADYYEAGHPIEGEFTDSWDPIEQFYDQVRFPPKPRVFELIKRLREADYDRTLRAGQSLFTFILSRSRRHGLRPEQSCMCLEFQSEHEMQASLKIGGTEKTFVTAIAPSEVLITSLNQLAESAID